MFLKILDISRIVIVSLAFYFGYQIGYAEETYNAVAQLHFMIPVVIFAIAGLSGLEGLFFGKKSAALKGFAGDRNYQKQSAFALVSFTVIALFVYFVNWGIKAELTIFFVFILFFFMSAINHGLDAIARKNYTWQNINRPFITFLLIAGMIYPIIMALKIL